MPHRARVSSAEGRGRSRGRRGRRRAEGAGLPGLDEAPLQRRRACGGHRLELRVVVTGHAEADAAHTDGRRGSQLLEQLAVFEHALAARVKVGKQVVNVASRRRVASQAERLHRPSELALGYEAVAILVPIAKEIEHAHRVGLQQLAQLVEVRLARRRVELDVGREGSVLLPRQVAAQLRLVGGRDLDPGHEPLLLLALARERPLPQLPVELVVLDAAGPDGAAQRAGGGGRGEDDRALGGERAARSDRRCVALDLRARARAVSVAGVRAGGGRAHRRRGRRAPWWSPRSRAPAERAETPSARSCRSRRRPTCA
eukprot:7388926-Prymnesium_polylepis.1